MLALWFCTEADSTFVKSLFHQAAYALQAEASVNTLTLYTPINLYPVLAIAWPKPGMRMGDSSSSSGFVWRYQETASSKHIAPALDVTFV